MPGHFTALGHQSQAPTPLDASPLGLAGDRDPARHNGDLAGDGLQQGAFAGAVRSHQGGEAAGGQGKGQMLQDGAIAPTHREVRNVQGGGESAVGHGGGGQGDLAFGPNLAIVRMKTIIVFKARRFRASFCFAAATLGFAGLP
jgi:hypothetical protein